MTEENKGTILYAEDERAIRIALEMFFERQFPDFDVESFKDGTSLEERLKGDVGGVRLIITDNKMPGPYGGQIINTYAQGGGFEHIPFILFYAGDKSLGESLADRYDNVSYLLKPVELGRFEEFIRETLNYSGRSKQSSQ